MRYTIYLVSIFLFSSFCGQSINKNKELFANEKKVETSQLNDPFSGEWTSYDKDLTITKIDKIYKLKFSNKKTQVLQTFNGNKVGELISYRDNNGIGQQIEIYIPVKQSKPNEEKLILDYDNVIETRLITSADGDYYKKIKSTNTNKLKGFAGSWKMNKKNFADIYETIKIDSISSGIQVAWKLQSWQTDTTYATFNHNILNVDATGADGGINFTYFKDCDCITAQNNKYFRYNENDEKFIGRWKNDDGEIYISKNGDYYLISIDDVNMDYTNTFLAKVNGNNLEQAYNKHSFGATYTTLKYVSPGIISWQDFDDIKKYSRVKN